MPISHNKDPANTHHLPTCVLLMGPTASGKTAIACELVRRYPMEIISVDSVMVYKGMDIGTAKPDPETRRSAPHRLLDILDPAKSYSAARFREDAIRSIKDIINLGRVPLLVGGTMLYFRALLHGLSELPSADQAIRDELTHKARKIGWAAMHVWLSELDPVTAAKIHPNDPQRIQRAIEVCLISDAPMSELLSTPKHNTLPCSPLKLALIPRDRELLASRIAKRFHEMINAGLVDEVRGLFERGDLGLDHPSIRAVGYRQVWAYLDGRISYDEMIERGVIATRQLAKRQLTWLRSESDLRIFDPYDNACFEKVFSCIGELALLPDGRAMC